MNTFNLRYPVYGKHLIDCGQTRRVATTWNRCWETLACYVASITTTSSRWPPSAWSQV